MKIAVRSSTTVVILAIVAGAGLLSTTTLVLLGLLSTRYPAHVPITPLSVTGAGIFTTVVPTAGYIATYVPSLRQTDIPTQISQPTLLARMSVHVAVPLQIPGPLVDPSLSLLSKPVDVPLEIQIPALKIKAAVLGVGLTMANAMASPLGSYADDPVWQTVFWYRGGSIPGDVGTATFAGHLDDTLGRPAVFAYLSDLHIGELIIVRDKRSGLDITFIVTETKTYTQSESADPTILSKVFGSKSVSGTESQIVSDQISRLTLITCDGPWMKGTFTRHLVVYAIRANYPTALGQ